MRFVTRGALVQYAVLGVAIASAAACGSKKQAPSIQVTLDLAVLRTKSPEHVCMELSRKLTDCGPSFAAHVALSLTARGVPPDDAAILRNMHTSLPGPTECRAVEKKAMDAVLDCYSNDCAALAACVLGEPHAIPDETSRAARCPDEARAFRGSDGAVHWCARADGTAHGLWVAQRDGVQLGAGTFSAGKRHGRFEMKATGRSALYRNGRITVVDGVDVSAMKSSDIDVDISVSRVARNSSAVATGALRGLLDGRGKADLTACADEQRLRDRFPRGLALVVLELGADGNVTGAASQSFDPQLSGCLASKAKTWRFAVGESKASAGRAYLVLAITTVHVPD